MTDVAGWLAGFETALAGGSGAAVANMFLPTGL